MTFKKKGQTQVMVINPYNLEKVPGKLGFSKKADYYEINSLEEFHKFFMAMKSRNKMRFEINISQLTYTHRNLVFNYICNYLKKLPCRQNWKIMLPENYRKVIVVEIF